MKQIKRIEGLIAEVSLFVSFVYNLFFSVNLLTNQLVVLSMISSDVFRLCRVPNLTQSQEVSEVSFRVLLVFVVLQIFEND